MQAWKLLGFWLVLVFTDQGLSVVAILALVLACVSSPTDGEKGAVVAAMWLQGASSSGYGNKVGLRFCKGELQGGRTSRNPWRRHGLAVSCVSALASSDGVEGAGGFEQGEGGDGERITGSG